MKDFASIELKVKKDVHAGEKESLLSLFDPVERFKRMNVLTDADEDSMVKVVLGELGEIDLKLGADMRTEKQKTIMTLFWYSERSQDFEIRKAAERGEAVKVQMILL